MRVREMTQNIGTKLYASPEQIESHRYDYRTDHFSAALVILELLFPVYTEMHRIKTLMSARQGSLPIELDVSFKVLTPGLSGLLKHNPAERAPLSETIRCLELEEMETRKQSRFSMDVEFRKEGEDTYREKTIVIQKPKVLVFGGAKDLKAECVFDTTDFTVSLKDSELTFESSLVSGCCLRLGDALKTRQLFMTISSLQLAI